MMDVLVEVCARGHLNPTTHALIVPSDSDDGLGSPGVTAGQVLPYTPSQSLQSLGVSSVRVVPKSSLASKHTDHQRVSSPAAVQPFEVSSLPAIVPVSVQRILCT